MFLLEWWRCLLVLALLAGPDLQSWMENFPEALQLMGQLEEQIHILIQGQRVQPETIPILFQEGLLLQVLRTTVARAQAIVLLLIGITIPFQARQAGEEHIAIRFQ